RPARPERHGPLARTGRPLHGRLRGQTRDHWATVFAESDACVTPVLSFAEVETEPHITDRDTFYRERDYLHPAPAPRFSRTVPSAPKPPGVPGVDNDDVLNDWT